MYINYLDKIKNKIKYEIDLEIYIKTIELFKIEKEMKKLKEIKKNVSLLKKTHDFFFKDNNEYNQKQIKKRVSSSQPKKKQVKKQETEKKNLDVNLNNKNILEKTQFNFNDKQKNTYNFFIETTLVLNKNEKIENPQKKITVFFKEYENIISCIFFHTPLNSKKKNCFAVKNAPFVYYTENINCSIIIDFFFQKEGKKISILHPTEYLNIDSLSEKKTIKEYFISEKEVDNSLTSKTLPRCFFCQNSNNLFQKNTLKTNSTQTIKKKLNTKPNLEYQESFNRENIKLIYKVENFLYPNENITDATSFLWSSMYVFIKDLISKSMENNIDGKKTVLLENVFETIKNKKEEDNKFDFLLENEE